MSREQQEENPRGYWWVYQRTSSGDRLQEQPDIAWIGRFGATFCGYDGDVPLSEIELVAPVAPYKE